MFAVGIFSEQKMNTQTCERSVTHFAGEKTGLQRILASNRSWEVIWIF